MRDDWEAKKLGEVCDTSAGGTPLKSHKDYYKNGTIPWLRSGEVGQGEILGSEKLITEKGLNNSSAKLFPPNSVLIAMYGATAGETGILRFEAATNQAVCAILPNDLFAPEYLYYFFLHYKQELISKAIGNAQPNLSQKKIKSTQIPIPPLSEQKRIVALLDEAFEALDRAKANIERNIENAEELFQSKLNIIFSERGEGWEEFKLENLIKLISGQHINTKNYNAEGNGVGYLTGPSDFGDINPTVSKWTEHPKRKAESGDILIAVKGSGVGKINMLDKDEIAISRQLMAIRAEKVSTRFLYSFMKIQYDRIQDLANGAAIPGISRVDVLNLKISVPDRVTQQNLVSKIDALEDNKIRIVENYRKKINGLEELKKSILQQAFSGQLTGESGLAGLEDQQDEWTKRAAEPEKEYET